jgi:hypothetical protein
MVTSFTGVAVSNVKTLRRFDIDYAGGPIAHGVLWPDGHMAVRTHTEIGGWSGVKTRPGGQAALDETVGKLNTIMGLIFAKSTDRATVRWVDGV